MQIGGDGLGDGIISELEADGVDTSLVLRAKGSPSPFTYIIVDRSGALAVAYVYMHARLLASANQASGGAFISSSASAAPPPPTSQQRPSIPRAAFLFSKGKSPNFEAAISIFAKQPSPTYTAAFSAFRSK
jgi:sugar/nucleoside kinase (ribokinase family)